ncbi:MAG: DUF6876 family protein, partial [Methylocystis sp.]
FWYRHPLIRKIVYTDGAKYVAEKGGAYWLLDEIAFAQTHSEKVAAEPFQHWKLSVNENRTADLVCDDGNGNIVYRKKLDFTDFPLPEIAFYCCDNTILLPSEY